MKKITLIFALLAIGCSQDDDGTKPCNCTYVDEIEIRLDSQVFWLKNDCYELRESESYLATPISNSNNIKVGDCIN